MSDAVTEVSPIGNERSSTEHSVNCELPNQAIFN